ncbi:MAG: archaeosortase/exosortase family protein, partial [Phycisphaerales bacterium]|nr:archaeosortase/exosortase family protein [Phycisphaerales bacterium]
EIGWGEWLQDWVATAGAGLASKLTSGISRRGNQIFGGGPILVVTLECTALFAKGLFCAAVYAFPCPWREKVWGFVVGLLGVAAVNVLRIAGLVLIGVYDTDWLEFAHLVLMQWFLISCVAPLWLAWAVWTGRRMRRRRAAE